MFVQNRRRALALGLALALATPHAFAQSNASGTIFGQVPAQAGTTVRIANVDTGLSRDITPTAPDAIAPRRFPWAATR